MSKYIDVEKIIIPNEKQHQMLTATTKHVGFGGARGGGKSFAVLLDWLNHQPAADVRGNVKSKWIENHFVDEKGNDYIGSVECDNCGRMLARKENYCPDCGADMRGEKQCKN